MIGVPLPRWATTVSRMSSRFSIQPTERIRYSAFPWWMTRPPTDELDRATAE